MVGNESEEGCDLKERGDFALSVIAGMGIGFKNGGGMKGRNRDWKIKSNPFLIGEGKGGIV
jgi:hypothetical protein